MWGPKSGWLQSGVSSAVPPSAWLISVYVSVCPSAVKKTWPLNAAAAHNASTSTLAPKLERHIKFRLRSDSPVQTQILIGTKAGDFMYSMPPVTDSTLVGEVAHATKSRISIDQSTLPT